MSPEKVAIVVVAGLIAVLLAVALIGTEPQGSQPGSGAGAGPGSERGKPAPSQIESYTYEDILKGRTRPRPPEEAKPQLQAAVDTTEYVVRKDDTIERIARRELGDRSYVGKIISLNKGLDPKKLRVGAKIMIPVVQRDTRGTTAGSSGGSRALPSRNRRATANARAGTSL
jgi:nucleoid-associated protein YgaU